MLYENEFVQYQMLSIINYVIKYLLLQDKRATSIPRTNDYLIDKKFMDLLRKLH